MSATFCSRVTHQGDEERDVKKDSAKEGINNRCKSRRREEERRENALIVFLPGSIP